MHRPPSQAIAADQVAQELPRSTEEFGLYELIGNVFSTLEFSMTLPDGFQYVQPGAYAGNAAPPESGKVRPACSPDLDRSAFMRTTNGVGRASI